MSVKRENLLVIAGVLWLVAGINVVNIGIKGLVVMGQDRILWLVLALLGAMVIYLGFHIMFSKMVLRYTARIFGMEKPRQNPFNFFDAKGYIIMAIMMTGGFGLRIAGLIPDWFVAFFYTGLGIALTLAGVGFIMHRIKGRYWNFHKSGAGAKFAAKADAEIDANLAEKAAAKAAKETDR